MFYKICDFSLTCLLAWVLSWSHTQASPTECWSVLPGTIFIDNGKILYFSSCCRKWFVLVTMKIIVSGFIKAASFSTEQACHLNSMKCTSSIKWWLWRRAPPKTCPPTVGRLSAICRPTVGRLSAVCWLSVSRLSADSWPTDNQQAFPKTQTTNWPTVSRQSATPTDDRQSANTWWCVGKMSITWRWYAATMLALTSLFSPYAT